MSASGSRNRRSVLLVLVVVGLLATVAATIVAFGPLGDRAGTPSPDGDVLTAAITGDATAGGTPVSDTLYGIFLEDINHAADGGLHAELVRNRSFEFSLADSPGFHGLTAWELVAQGGADADVTVESDDPLNDTNLHYARVTVRDPGGPDGAVVLRNEGFNTGIVVREDEGYDVGFWARHDGPDELLVRFAVEDEAGTTNYGGVDVAVEPGGWRHYEAELTASASTTAGRLAVAIAGPAGTVIDLDMVSLFPQDTFMGRPGGLRRDLAERIAALEPSFLRFPGGCLVNAGSFEPFPERSRVYNWKDTIGPVEERSTNANFWGYNHSYGLGYLEYFQFAADLGAEPIPVVPVGVNGCGQNHRLTTPEELAPWVQNTLDLIEFANGDVDTEWGARRAELGHPEPFGLTYIGIGNEEYDSLFYANYPHFADAIRREHPDIRIISNSGTESSGAVFDSSWEFAREQGADLVDEHYYNSPAWFLGNTDRYDDYDRDGPQVMVGEYASQANSFGNALAEAAYLTGIERNSDVVRMAAYAPLLANVDYVDWTPDLIWFDNHRAYGTSSYYVQQLFATNRGDRVVPTSLDAADADDAEPDPITGSIGLGTWNTVAAYSNVRVTATDGTDLFEDDFTGGTGQWAPAGPADGPPVGWWEAGDGELRQTRLTADARMVAGDPDWSNYSFEVEARKLSGSEGFLIMFGVRDTGSYYWWNLGGWGNTTSAIEVATHDARTTIAGSDHTIEAGRTYHIRVEVEGRRIRTYLDGELVHDLVDGSRFVEPVYHVVTRDDDTGEVVLKVVNAQAETLHTQVDLGPADLADTATVTTLTAESLADENSLDDPERIAPVVIEQSGFGSAFTYDFPGHSVTFIRLRPPDG